MLPPIASTVRRSSLQLKEDTETEEGAAASQGSHVYSERDARTMHATSESATPQGLHRQPLPPSSSHALPVTSLGMPRLNLFWLKKEPPRTTHIRHEKELSGDSSEDSGFSQVGSASHGTLMDDRYREVISDLSQTHTQGIEDTNIASGNLESSPSAPSSSPSSSQRSSEYSTPKTEGRQTQDGQHLSRPSSDNPSHRDAELSPLSRALQSLDASHQQQISSTPEEVGSKAKTAGPPPARPPPKAAAAEPSNAAPPPPPKGATATPADAGAAPLTKEEAERAERGGDKGGKGEAAKVAGKEKTAGPPPARPPPKSGAAEPSKAAPPPPKKAATATPADPGAAGAEEVVYGPLTKEEAERAERGGDKAGKGEAAELAGKAKTAGPPPARPPPKSSTSSSSSSSGGDVLWPFDEGGGRTC
ncbi:uncharacterized protein EMH_0097690 [Eimeria mitis]|uniref:Uncharacterized protein n=1 Tax=Eimeria mitis TaxID=44415 RepID=U6KGT9_9EIME|nr:uncharacterized protein EMH_0097690 [Eimeria mitis]CDJ35462.1 hypothetical protein, conserved [Eimeria mitis]